MTPNARRVGRLYSTAPLIPLVRIADAPPGVWLAAAAIGATEFLLRLDLFVLAWFLLFGVAAFDYAIGSVRADIEGRYDDDIRRAKLLGKVTGLSVMWFVYGAELLVLRAGLDTGRVFSVTLTALLIIDELRGLNRHKRELTGRPVPLLGDILDWLERILSRRIAPPTEPAPEVDR